MEVDYVNSEAGAAAAGAGCPRILAEPLKRGEGMAIDALAYLDDELDEDPGSFHSLLADG